MGLLSAEDEDSYCFPFVITHSLLRGAGTPSFARTAHAKGGGFLRFPYSPFYESGEGSRHSLCLAYIPLRGERRKARDKQII
jgi:hypothetical protein